MIMINNEETLLDLLPLLGCALAVLCPPVDGSSHGSVVYDNTPGSSQNNATR